MDKKQIESFSKFRSDTGLEAMRVYYQCLSRMTPEQRLDCLSDMFDATNAFAEAGIRMIHPEYDGERVRMEVIRRRLGPQLFSHAYPEFAG